jgi:L,D-transpeptidase ErfK/SrfK
MTVVYDLVRHALMAWLAFTLCSDPQSAAVTGSVRAHEIAEGETLTSVGARFGVEPWVLAKDNGLAANARLRTGDRLIVDSRHIAPSAIADGIVLNVAQRMLFVFENGEPVRAFPIAVGMPDWPTPRGRFAVLGKEIDPVWDVPVSIQQEMARKGKPILTTVPPGPGNPLGNRWLALSAQNVGIHGTNQPSSIYRFTTHGCIRLHPDDMLELFDLVDVGASVEITYQPFMLARYGDGTAFLEVHPDPYRQGGSPEAQVRNLLSAAELDYLADSPAVRQAIAERAGRAVAISP